LGSEKHRLPQLVSLHDDGYRPSEIARALNVHPRKVDRWVNRAVRPNAEDALALADLVTRMKRRAKRAQARAK
jgi:hypothetical protein